MSVFLFLSQVVKSGEDRDLMKLMTFTTLSRMVSSQAGFFFF